MIQVGEQVPDLVLPASDGTMVSLKQYAGKYVVLYFYPKDMTPGCTTEACEFRDMTSQYEALNAMIVGVSPDPLKSHEKFIQKHELPFLLLSDEEHALAEAFGVWKLKKMYGREYMGIERSTFIIDPEGKLLKEWRKVKVKGHVEDVLNILKALQS
ncbi:thioredoxin-dependent thiol peroxidase [Rubeoparvulum massiliense]|uniref:thioredoxin-dependent thiol peroxidase n=1 Tax=Rubeoparvulum massiliense TaxID=1631346 RepID=UPI00065E6B09|nr:thioredoxin-dependent thiol peroxidase [Rubeoparvulum massiliense]